MRKIREEELRRSAIEKLGLQSGLADPDLDRIVRLTAMAHGTRGAAFSVKHDEYQVYVSSVHWDAPVMSRQDSLCAQVCDEDQALFVGRISAAHPIAEHPMVGAYRLNLYCSVPVHGPEGQVVGALSVFDVEGRELAVTECRLLTECAGLIEDALRRCLESVRDSMTGVFNRRYCDQQIQIEWRRACRLLQPISIALVTLDDLEAVNERCGTQTGDLALSTIARQLGGALRRAGDTVARYGGSQFMVILPSTTERDAAVILERVRASIEALQIENPDSPHGAISVSIGVAAAELPAELLNGDVEHYVERAERVLKEARQSGGNCVLRVSGAGQDGGATGKVTRLVDAAGFRNNVSG